MKTHKLPKTIECHCMATAHIYRQRSFINGLNQTVYRGYYRCGNCASRVQSDEIPEFDKLETIKVGNWPKIDVTHFRKL